MTGPTVTFGEIRVINRRARVSPILQLRREITAQLGEIERQLALLDKHPNASFRDCFITFKRLRHDDHAGLQGLSDPRSKLMEDRKALRAELASLRRRASRNKTRRMRLAAQDAAAAFRNRLERVLREAETAGTLDPALMESLGEEGVEVLDALSEVLERDPSPANFGLTLRHTEQLMLLGVDVEGGPDARASMERAQRRMRNAAQTVTRRCERRFRAVPSADNLGPLIRAAAREQLLVADSSYMPDAPPPDAVRSDPRAVYRTESGDTLAKISSQFYNGKPFFWDRIYFRNIEAIGEDPDRLPAGIELTIP